jgi:hypothetical protein
MMSVLAVVFVVLMVLWLFGGVYLGYGTDRATLAPLVGHTLIPWLCVAILGWIVLGGGHLPPPR